MVGAEEFKDLKLWVCDTGAGCHMTGSLKGLLNVKKINQRKILGDGRSLNASKIGDLELKIKKSGTQATLKDVKVVPGLTFSLFSVSYALKSGAKIKSEGDGIIVSKDNTEIWFNEIIDI
jgi:hypothetical protein